MENRFVVVFINVRSLSNKIERKNKFNIWYKIRESVNSRIRAIAPAPPITRWSGGAAPVAPMAVLVNLLILMTFHC